MKSTSKLVVTGSIAAAIALAGISFAAIAKGPYDGAIEARQGMFELFSFNSGILGDMAKENMEYDADIALEAAKNLEAAANLGQSQFWPEGSDSESDGNLTNRALPAIWDDMPDFMEKMEALRTESAKMAMVAGDGLEAVQGAMGDVGGTCKACHDNYRAERK